MTITLHSKRYIAAIISLMIGYAVLLGIQSKADWIDDLANFWPEPVKFESGCTTMIIHISEHYPLVKEHDLLGNTVGREMWDTQAYGNTVAIYTDGTDAGRYFSAQIPIGSTNRGDQPWTPGYPPQ
jgi:hypothetical protein